MIFLQTNYSFRVIAGNNDGAWNESVAFLDLTIAPAYLMPSG
jgi:hypothetical protein